MQLLAARSLYTSDLLECAELHPSPNDTEVWVVLIRSSDGKTYFIVDENEKVRQVDLNKAVSIIRQIGFHSVEVFF
tara:strand:- start:1151 stop:1378 length:228 start_codon:yes stop_codon:yes gene_type:complete